MKSNSLNWLFPVGQSKTQVYWPATCVAFLGFMFAMSSVSNAVSSEKAIIGAVAEVDALGHDLDFVARVDTGATTCSLHVEKWEIVGEAPEMADNVGKTIRFLTTNHRGESEWVERKIAELSVVKTSEREEARYKVPMKLACGDVEKRVLVSLNDRSHMKYAMLLGRNFLDGDFLVDVSQSETKP